MANQYLSAEGLNYFIQWLKENHININGTTDVIGHVKLGPVSTPLTTMPDTAAPAYHTHSNFVVQASNVYVDPVTTLDRTIADIYSIINYNAVMITAFTSDHPVSELGTVLPSVTLTYTINQVPYSATLNGTTQVITSTSGTIVTGSNLSATTTYTLVATDEKGATSSKSTTVAFYNGIYYGVSYESTTYDGTFMETLTKQLSGTKSRSITLNPGVNQYIFYCLPTRLGTPSFSVGGFEGGFSLLNTFSYLNPSGYREEYAIYKSDYANLGQTTVVVS